ncbi:MAG: hypothetical protein KKD18_03680 [Nanoarchaeota archaeon]|nr:hypothetical protein [Nanoarchaeota archaeon]MBU0977491.1 hypothetical protein [Nanoarchaeota archaeon]
MKRGIYFLLFVFILVAFLRFVSSTCNDGIDNDQDGFIDYPADVDCDNESDSEFPAGGFGDCVEDWDCGLWGDCIDDTRMRSCYDFNVCGTEFNKPAEQVPCDSSAGDDFLTNSRDGTRYDLMFAWTSLGVSVAVLVVIVLTLFKLRSSEKSSPSLVDSRKELIAQVKSQGKK